MSTLQELEFKTKLEEGTKQINLLWKCNKEDRDKAVKLLQKIFGNILKNPNNPKYHSISFAAMMKRFKNSRPGLHILFAAGFSQTVDGTKIQIKPIYFNHLKQVLGMLEKKLAEPEIEKEPTPPSQPKPIPAPVAKKEAVEEKVSPKPKPEHKPESYEKRKHPEWEFALEGGSAIVVLENYGQAKAIVETLNGATIGENKPIKVELFIPNEDVEQSSNQGLSIDDEDVEQSIISRNVKISGLFEGMPESTLKTLVEQATPATPCTIKEIYYKRKVRRGAALGGGSEIDELRSQIDTLKGKHTRITNADVEGKTPEEKARIIMEKKEQYRKDKAKIAFKEKIEKSANERRNRKAAFELKHQREQNEMDEIIRQRKKAKERERREKERVRAKIKADKERRKREREERERSKRGNV